jgi:pyruvate-ferredoxin/flavodoxin oxidoreductase
LQLDSRPPKQKVVEYLLMENRFKMLTKINPDHAKLLFKMAQEDADTRFRFYEYLAARKLTPDKPAEPTPPAVNA